MTPGTAADVSPDAAPAYPAADRLLPISPGDHRAGRDLIFVAEGLWRAGATQLLVREPEISSRELVAALRRLAPSARRLILHARCPDAVALARAGGWGLHLPGDADVARARDHFSGWLGYSAHSREDAIRAWRAGVDYVTVSPVWAPISKPDDVRPTLRAQGAAAIQEAVGVPVFALGGMTPTRALESRRAGVFGVAAIGGIFGPESTPEDVAQRTGAMLDALREADANQLALSF